MQTDLIIETIRKAVSNLIALYRFGSQVHGTAGPDSDVDVAILTFEALSPLTLFDLQQELAAVLHKDVDLVDLASAPTVMRMQVLSTGECLFSGNDRTREEFETSVFSSYARLNEERRGILDDVRARGSVYGR